ncbi:hypothetical protein DFH07DRAFT_1029399 [Mycena maculata]|uniref:TPR-like protein n=1 Tax=Mycena maculata TaxID=230809 RepID=A0AAD7NC07_9AGAR|nr:hypothetical protein DFH07DRAFT_1029399 [Mycena maculata]
MELEWRFRLGLSNSTKHWVIAWYSENEKELKSLRKFNQNSTQPSPRSQASLHPPGLPDMVLSRMSFNVSNILWALMSSAVRFITNAFGVYASYLPTRYESLHGAQRLLSRLLPQFWITDNDHGVSAVRRSERHRRPVHIAVPHWKPQGHMDHDRDFHPGACLVVHETAKQCESPSIFPDFYHQGPTHPITSNSAINMESGPQNMPGTCPPLDLGNPETMEQIAKLIEQTPEGDPALPKYHQTLGKAFAQQYRKSGDLKDLETGLQNLQTLGNIQDLEAGMKNIQKALELAPDGHPERARLRHGLGVFFIDRYKKLGNLKDLEDAVQNFQAAVDLTPYSQPERVEYMQGLLTAYIESYHKSGDLSDLDLVMQKAQEVVDLAPKEHPHRAAHRLHGLAVSFTARFQKLGNLEDLEAAHHNYQAAVDLTPDGHPDKAGYLHGLAVSFTERYKTSREPRDQDNALQNFRAAVDLTPENHPDRAGCMHGLGLALSNQYQRSKDLKDLEAALQTLQQAVKMTPADHPSRSGCLQSLAMSHGQRYQSSGDLKDLEAMIQLAQNAVNLIPFNHPGRAGYLHRLGVAFELRYRRLGQLPDLQYCPGVYVGNLRDPRRPVMSRREKPFDPSLPVGIPRELMVVSRQVEIPKTSGCTMTTEFFGQRDFWWMKRPYAVSMHQDAVRLIPDGHPAKAECLGSLARILMQKYKKSGDLVDLDVSLVNFQLSVSLTPKTHYDKSQRLDELAAALISRYERLGNLQDLETAIQNYQQAIDLAFLTSEKAKCINRLASCFQGRYSRLGDFNDLTTAIEHYRAALRIVTDDKTRIKILKNLHTCLANFYQTLAEWEWSGRLVDVDWSEVNDMEWSGVNEFMLTIQEARGFAPGESVDETGNLGNLISDESQTEAATIAEKQGL